MDKVIKKIKKYCRRTLTLISPMANTEICYFVKFHSKLNLKNPQTLNEKNLWLKLKYYESNNLVKICSDKYRVREYVEKCGCREILNELIAVYYDTDSIEWDKLPQKFAMKLNVGSGANIICNDKNEIDIYKAKKEIRKWFKSSYYLDYSEMQYKNVKPCVVVEKYISDGTGLLPIDYKFYCFNGKAEYVMVCIGREETKRPKFYFFDRNWNFYPFDEKNNPGIKKPKLMDKAFKYADILSEPFPYVRTDLYITDQQVIFGELTFTSYGGLDDEISEEGLLIMGSKIDLNYVSANKQYDS